MGERRTAGSYSEYLKVPELLRLQTTLSVPPAHDETLFIIVHQVYELWFKQLLHEIDAIVDLLIEGRTQPATRLCRRVAEIQRVLIQQLRILETMTAPDFVQFRDVLNPASGFQSYQFRAFEFRLGLKDRRFFEHHRADPNAVALLESALQAPSLPDVWSSLLRSRGLDYPETPSADGERRRIDALRTIYEDSARYYDLYMLAEALVEVDENLLLWRQHHLAMVERMIGMKQGTGGSSGVEYLKTTLDRKCFPELWAVRTAIGRPFTYG